MAERDLACEAIRKVFHGRGATFTDRDGVLAVEVPIAERRSLLSRRRLTYSARFRVDEQRRVVRFTEMLKEAGWGLPGSGALGGPGLGVEVRTWKSGRAPREERIDAQARDLAGRFELSFDLGANRAAVRKALGDVGYALEYHVLSVDP
jgi:hypothetical protein